nr:hypothetical protein CFP56_15179 [Quercus suber]
MEIHHNYKKINWLERTRTVAWVTGYWTFQPPSVTHKLILGYFQNLRSQFLEAGDGIFKICSTLGDLEQEKLKTVDC